MNISVKTQIFIVENNIDPFMDLRDTAENSARNLGFALDLPQLSPELWQKVLVATETRMRMRGIELPSGWREKLAGQIWRPPGADGTQSTNWLAGQRDRQRRLENAPGPTLYGAEQKHSHASDDFRT